MIPAALISLGFLAAQPAAAAPEDWQEVAQLPRGTVSLDRASIQRTGDIVILRSRTVLAEAQEDGTRTILIRARYHCRLRRSETLSMSTLGEDGSVILSQEIPDDQRQFEPVIADSPDAAVAAVACQP